ncbi:MAG: hypothetical protein ACOX3L_03850 [Lutisporaceae bacterium]
MEKGSKHYWQGDTSGYASASEADLALCGMLAFWCGRDIGQMDRLFSAERPNARYNGIDHSPAVLYGMITIRKSNCKCY